MRHSLAEIKNDVLGIASDIVSRFGEHDDDNSFTQTNLVSDGTVPAKTTDPNLINPWGISTNGHGVFWVSDNGAGVTTLYKDDGAPVNIPGVGPAVTIATPPGQTTPGAPTGQVFNTTQGFDISQNGKTAPAVFLFATEDGTISGWNPTVNPGSSVLAVDNSHGGAVQGGDGAVYKGLAIGTDKDGTFLYAANFRNDSVDVFNSQFQMVKSFTDPNLPNGYAPFNVQVLEGKLFVTFAKQNADRHDDVAGKGNGFVDEFSLQGRLIDRIASGGPLNSPWGLAIAPSGFGDFGGDLVVGNFGDGTINVFNLKNDHFAGKVDGADGKPIRITDLWALQADGNNLLFTAGLKDEAHGLFGSLSATPDPHSSMMSMVSSNSHA